MRAAFYTAVYLLGLALLASVVAGLLAKVLDYEYIKILSRVLLLLVALSLIPLWRLNGLNRDSIGFYQFSARRFGLCFAASVAMLLPLMLFFLVSQFRIIDPRVVLLSGEFVQTMLVITVGAILVAVFEETLFRGFLQRLLGDRMGVRQAILLISILYGLVHFLEPSEEIVVDPHLLTGIMEILKAIAGATTVAQELTSFLSLVGIGIALGFAREKYGLWVPIALHAGWVVGIRTYKELTVRDVLSPYAEWTGTYDNFIGPLTLFWLVFILVLILLVRRYRENHLPVGTK